MEKKIYSKPVLTAETFEPQEYCATCWLVTLRCQGESDSQGNYPRYVYNASGQQIGDLHDSGNYGGKHYAHETVVDLRCEDGVIPTVENVEDIIASSETTVGDYQITRARSTNNHYWYDGWSWYTPDVPGVHFAEVPVITRYDARPNHS